MHVHVLARQRADHNQIPPAGVQALADALSAAGCSVVPDARPSIGRPFEAAVRECLGQLQRSFGRPPDVVHAFGTVAAEAALRWRPVGSRIVVTFDEAGPDQERELGIARRADAVLAVSEADFRYWRSLGIQTLSFGGVPALPVLDLPTVEGRQARRDLIGTTSTGATIEALIDALPRWTRQHLVLLAEPPARRWRELQARAGAAGVAGRLHLHPARDSATWSRLAAFVAGPDVARSGADCALATAHAAAVVAVAEQAHRDIVLHGITGVLVEPQDWASSMARTVDALLADAIRARAMGEAGRVRVRALHDRDHGGSRLRMLYQRLLDGPRGGPGQPAYVQQGNAEPATEAQEPGAAHRAGAGRLSANRYQLVLEHLPYATQLAKRYAGRGQSLDDLAQVAAVGLVNAAARFDPDHGTDFYAYATPTILGELRRHFRDHAWAVRVPRTLQETTIRVQHESEARAGAGLPTSASAIAEALGLVEEEVLTAQQTHLEARATHSLDLPIGERGDEFVADIVGDLDRNLEHVESVGAVRKALRQLPARERDILLLRYFGERTQTEIADILGISQVQVSRLLSRTLAAIRDHVLDEEPLPRRVRTA